MIVLKRQGSSNKVRGEHGPEPRLSISVVFTDMKATLLAMQTAAQLAKSLNARIVLIAIEVVPVQLPVDEPPVPLSCLENSLCLLVAESEIDAEEVSIELCLGRDRQQCLHQILRPRSLVVIGGRRRWRSEEQKLATWLNSNDFQVVFVDVDSARDPVDIAADWQRANVA